MSASDHLLSIGVNTGNSLDAADVVLTKFGVDGSISDLEALSVPMPEQLADSLRLLRSAVVDAAGDMEKAIHLYEQRAANTDSHPQSADDLIRRYTLYVGAAVKELTNGVADKLGADATIDVIGFHGQTCAHQPPSIARDAETAYTVQIGDGQLLADETGIPVVFDFRSDDLMNGGEAAPLAPVHHEHLARHLKTRGIFPIAFCNAGNTGNISVITERPDHSVFVIGWDVGPFNDYPDKLVQRERALPCDVDGKIGAQGKVNADLLRLLFEKSAVNEHGTNYLLQPPPKSSDPQWYRQLPELCGEAKIGSNILSFEDRLRTAEYFAAYVYYFSLKWIPSDLPIPTCFALCGGGWNNPVCRDHFEKLLRGEFDHHPVLAEHKEVFAEIFQRLNSSGRAIETALADQFGFSGQYMEARLFADAAVCRVMGVPFTRPETSGCRTPTVLGIIRFPHGRKDLASHNLKQWLSRYASDRLTLDDCKLFDRRWSRATQGWHSRSQMAGRTV
jgi:anhydro-N-acetylmuramic acid kinase